MTGLHSAAPGTVQLAPAHDPQTTAATMAPMESSTGSLRMFLIAWPFMLTAMMAPLLIPALRHAHARSLPSRRRRTLTLLIAAYAAVWSAGGFLLFGLATVTQALPGDGTVTIVLGIAAAAIWQLSPLKQRCLNRHHVQPAIAAFGRPADGDAPAVSAVCTPSGASDPAGR